MSAGRRATRSVSVTEEEGSERVRSWEAWASKQPTGASRPEHVAATTCTPFRYHVTIPTLNAGSTIAGALSSVLLQANPRVTVNVVDSYSSDDTAAVVNGLGVSVLRYEGRLLGARHVGLQSAGMADYVLLLDADQVLAPSTLARLDAYLQQAPRGMVILGERSYNPRTVVQRMYDLDRRLVQRDFERYASPGSGVMLPRVFRRDLLTAAFAAIPASLYLDVVTHDHAILYYEAARIWPAVGYLEDAVYHRELSSLRATYRHFRAYGSNARLWQASDHYQSLTAEKMRGRRKGMLHPFPQRLFTLPLLAAKAAGYYRGLLFRSGKWKAR